MSGIKPLLGAAAVTVAAAAFAGLPVTAANAAAAQAAPASIPTFGSVNIDEVVSQSNQHKKDGEEMQTMVTRLQNVLGTLQQNTVVFLNDAEMRELAGLYEKETPTETEKKRISTLETANEARKKELANLESTAAPTDEQRRRQTELGNMRQAGDQDLAQLKQDLQERLSKREQELVTKQLDQIRSAIAAVAKAKGLTVVFDNKVAVYTNNDITADVVKQVNK